jgi:GNAT superfamily N-acetyltransferase
MDLSLEIRRVVTLPSDIEYLRIEATSEGFSFMEKLVNEWKSAANRFDKSGEIFAGAFENERLVAVCGLNIDPYMADSSVARLRHLYVLKSVRRKGVASSLVRYLLDIAGMSFTDVRLFTDTANAAVFYETLGFSGSKSSTASYTLRVG